MFADICKSTAAKPEGRARAFSGSRRVRPALRWCYRDVMTKSGHREQHDDDKREWAAGSG